MAGGIPVRVPLKLPDYSIDWNRVADSLTSRTRLIIINTPHNPCGVTWRQAIWTLWQNSSETPEFWYCPTKCMSIWYLMASNI